MCKMGNRVQKDLSKNIMLTKKTNEKNASEEALFQVSDRDFCAAAEQKSDLTIGVHSRRIDGCQPQGIVELRQDVLALAQRQRKPLDRLRFLHPCFPL